MNGRPAPTPPPYLADQMTDGNQIGSAMVGVQYAVGSAACVRRNSRLRYWPATEGFATHHLHARGLRGNMKRSLAPGTSRARQHWRFTATYPAGCDGYVVADLGVTPEGGVAVIWPPLPMNAHRAIS